MRAKLSSSPFLISGLLSLIICACLAFWQKDNLKSVWNEYRSWNRSFCYSPNNNFVPRIPAIKGKIAESDPQAAAIANRKLDWLSNSKDEQIKVRDEQIIETLSENILKFSQNQYFLYELAKRLSFIETSIDPAILLKLSERLIELDNQNAMYYYIKAFVLFRDRKNNNFGSVSQAIKQANACEYQQPPYLIYRDRVVSIAKKQGLHRHLIEELNFTDPQNFFVRGIYDTLIQYQNLLITEGDFTKADETANLIKNLSNDHTSYSRLSYNFAGGFGFWNLPQMVELQRKNLSQQKADQKRLEICAMINPEKKDYFTYKHYEPDKKQQPYTIAVSPFLHFVMMAGVFTIVTAILLMSGFFWTDCLNIKISKLGLFRFLIYSSAYFLSGQFLLIRSFWHSLDRCCSYLNVFSAPRSTSPT